MSAFSKVRGVKGPKVFGVLGAFFVDMRGPRDLQNQIQREKKCPNMGGVVKIRALCTTFGVDACVLLLAPGPELDRVFTSLAKFAAHPTLDSI